MTEMPPFVFETRPVVILELPLPADGGLFHLEQVMLKIGGRVHDVGAFCYTLRSNKWRKQGKSRKVVPGSFRKDRLNQIRQIIKTISAFLTEEGMKPRTVEGLLASFKGFIDWADANGHQDCLSGGDATRGSFRSFAAHIEDRFLRHEIERSNASRSQSNVLSVLEKFSTLTDIGRGIRFIKKDKKRIGGTEPAIEFNFAHALALNDAMFQGFCNLVLDEQPFPFKLAMPKSLGWKNDFLWVFPTPMWFLPPHQWGEVRVKLAHASWVCNYEQGRLSTVGEIWHRYSGSEGQKRRTARRVFADAAESLKAANTDNRSHYRRMLAMAAHNAFYFLFLANTGGNVAPTANIETDGSMDETTANPGYRSIKWRAHGREVRHIVPVAFVPSLRRYLKLRNYLLNGEAFPYLFLGLGLGKRNVPKQVTEAALSTQYNLLRRIDPELGRMGVHKIRATASSYYKQKHDAEIEATVLQHTKETEQASYDAGTEFGHHVELTLLMEKIAQKAQQVVAKGTIPDHARLLEEGGSCQSYGEPQAMASNVPVQPNCKKGCLFCTKRVLIAGEEDTRKVASAAFLMEQLIMGPLSEAEFRPQIAKCDDDLAKIRAFDGCEPMVDRIKKDVFENGNLTPYFQDKFELFLALGVL